MVADPLSSLGLRDVQYSDKALFERYLQSVPNPLSDYGFSQVYTWRNSLKIVWRELRGHLCVFANGCGDLTLLLPPMGDGGSDAALREAFEIMDAYNAARGVPRHSRVEYVSAEMLQRFDAAKLEVRRHAFDYLYDSARMIDLAGGDLASKRQARNRFIRNYRHWAEPYDAARHLDGCLALLGNWRTQHEAHEVCDGGSTALKRQKESLACELALREATMLGLKGIVVYVADGAAPEAEARLAGFTLGHELGADQANIVVEKTDLNCKGLAQFIFAEFCARCWSHRPLINAGDDWGIENLAWTKASYRPVKLLEKFVLQRVPALKVVVPDIAPAAAAVAPAPMADAIEIRPARRGDVEAQVELERLCFVSHRIGRRQMQYLQASPRAVTLTAESHGRVVGHIVGLQRRHRRCMSGRVYSLAVHPDYRGRGLGRRLMQAMLTELAARQTRRVYLEVELSNASAVKLYEHLGFRRIGVLSDYYAPGRPGLHMMLTLPSPAEPVRAPAELAPVAADCAPVVAAPT